MTNAECPVKADQYRHPDGTTEIVFAVEDETVLTFREYRDVETFRRAVARARYEGTHEGVAELPDAEEFRECPPGEGTSDVGEDEGNPGQTG